jgi:hypothetical protein
MRRLSQIAICILLFSEFGLSAAYFGHLPSRSENFLHADAVWHSNPTPETTRARQEALNSFRAAEARELRALRALLITNTLLLLLAVLAGLRWKRRPPN